MKRATSVSRTLVGLNKQVTGPRAGTMPLLSSRHFSSTTPVQREKPRVKELRAYVVQKDEAGADYHRQQSGHWIIDTPISNPMSVYPPYRKSRVSWGIDVLGTVIVEAELEDGTVGVGTSIGGEPACYLIENHFSRFVEGQDVRNVELMWDQMWRGSMPYGRKGLAIQALSAVDLALWDCLGKLWQEPIYNLLGGKTKEKLPVYATTSRPDLAKKMGFHAAKFPLPYSHAEGEEGMRKNIECVRKHRESVGPDFPLMIDCYMSLTVPYAIALAKAVEPYKIKWIEEFLPPDDYDGYSQVKKGKGEASCLLTTGEHEYTRYGFRELIERRCVDILQPDITWVGGLTEAKKIYSMAAAYDIPVIPHGSSVFSYHLQFAYANSPMAEILIMSPKADKVVPVFANLFTNEPLPDDQGYLQLDENKHGWGVDLNKDGLKLQRPYPRHQH